MTEIELADLCAKLRSMHTDPIGCGLARQWHVNPDGPEAADKLEALSRENAWQYERLVETQMLAHKWMEAHDKLKAGKPYDFPKPADLPETVEALSGRIAVLEGALAALRPAVDEQEGRKGPTEAHIGCEHCEIEVTVPLDQDTCPLCGWPLWETDDAKHNRKDEG